MLLEARDAMQTMSREDSASRERLGPHIYFLPMQAQIGLQSTRHLWSAMDSDKVESGHAGDLCEADLREIILASHLEVTDD